MKSEKYENRLVDPNGVELGLAIFSTAITTISFIYQFGPKIQRYQLENKIREIRREILRLQNSIDDFVLTLERMSNNMPDMSLHGRKVSMSDTMFKLRDRDYQRWILIQDAVKRIDQKLYKTISEIREMELGEEEEKPISPKLMKTTDELILGMGRLSFDDFVVSLRNLLNEIDKELSDMMYSKKN